MKERGAEKTSLSAFKKKFLPDLITVAWLCRVKPLSPERNIDLLCERNGMHNIFIAVGEYEKINKKPDQLAHSISPMVLC